MSVSRELPQLLPKTAFGEVSVAENTPILSVIHTYGKDFANTKSWIKPGLGTATDSSTIPAAVEVTTAASAGAFLQYRSQRSLTYRPGRGALLRQTAIFSSPVSGNRQLAGALNILEGFAFGYDTNQKFGILYRYGGKYDIWTLTVTGAAAGGENATITVNGTEYTVPLTAGTTAHNAAEIQASLQAQLAASGYFVANTESTVSLARAYDTTPLSTMAFSSGTATGSWTNDVAGVASTYDWVYQEDWNGQKVPWLDPTKGNVYEITYQYLGYGEINFKIENPGTGELVTVHSIRYANSAGRPSLNNANLFGTWEVHNVSNASAVTLVAGCAFGAVQGKDDKGRVNVHILSKTGVSTTETYMFALRNDLKIGSGSNQSSIKVLRIQGATDSTKGAVIRAYKYATLTLPQWVNHTTTNDASHTSVDTLATAFATTNATDYAILLVGPSGRTVWDADADEHTIRIYPNETLVFTASVLSGASSQVDVAIEWEEGR